MGKGGFCYEFICIRTVVVKLSSTMVWYKCIVQCLNQGRNIYGLKHLTFFCDKAFRMSSPVCEVQHGFAYSHQLYSSTLRFFFSESRDFSSLYRMFNKHKINCLREDSLRQASSRGKFWPTRARTPSLSRSLPLAESRTIFILLTLSFLNNKMWG